MNDEQYEKLTNTILSASAGDTTIMTGLPNVDLSDSFLKYVRILEICFKVEGLKKLNREETDYYGWYDNLGYDNPKEEIMRYWFYKHKK